MASAPFWSNNLDALATPSPTFVIMPLVSHVHPRPLLLLFSIVSRPLTFFTGDIFLAADCTFSVFDEMMKELPNNIYIPILGATNHPPTHPPPKKEVALSTACLT
jgi:hypothetical protein